MINKKQLNDEILEGIEKYSQSVIHHKGAVLERENLVALSYAYEVLNKQKCSDDGLNISSKQIAKAQALNSNIKTYNRGDK